MLKKYGGNYNYLDRKSSLTKRRISCGNMLSVSIFALSTFSYPVLAQTRDGGGLDEIVVTAQKREQRMQDVPIAVTAVTAEALQSNRITNVADLSSIAPGLTARKPAGSTGSIAFTLRGNVVNAAAPGADKAISTYLDGVYIGGTRGSVFDFPDIAQIEVLRGPQGTLFGRNSTAGAISVTTRDPSGKLHFKQEVSVGNRSLLRTVTSVDLPQVGPFSAYLSYLHDEQHGDVRNLGAGTVYDRTRAVSGIGIQSSPEWLGSKNNNGIFAAIKFEPSDQFKMVYKFDRSISHFTPDARATLAINAADPLGVGGLLSLLLLTQPAGGGPFGPVVLAPSAERPDAINNSYTVPGVLRTSGHNLTITAQLTDQLSLKNITAYRKAFSYSAATVLGRDGLVITPSLAAIIPSFSPLIGRQFLSYDGNNQGDNKQFSNELQFIYTGHRATVTVGGLYYYEKIRNGSVPGMAANFVFTTVGADGILPLGGELNDYTTTKSLAAYAQAEIHVTDHIDIVGGARLTNDRRNGYHSDSVIGNLPFTYEKTKPNFSVSLNYMPTDDVLAYVKWANGFVSGGSVAGFSFTPETVESYEAGIKSETFDRRLRVNLALWTATYKDLQTAQGGANFGFPTVPVLVVNAGKLKAHGFELEVTAAPVNGLLLGGSLGYTKGQLRDSPAFLTTPNFGSYTLGGNPEWTANLNAQYELPISGDTSFVVRMDGNYRSKNNADANPNIGQFIPTFAPYAVVGGRWLLNGRAAIKNISLGPVKGELALWGRNLTDNKSMAYPLPFAQIVRTASFETARSYGLDLTVKY